jgi:hypothetical protein
VDPAIHCAWPIDVPSRIAVAAASVGTGFVPDVPLAESGALAALGALAPLAPDAGDAAEEPLPAPEVPPPPPHALNAKTLARRRSRILDLFVMGRSQQGMKEQLPPVRTAGGAAGKQR